MRLGDVLTESDDEGEAPPPRRRRFGLWIALWLLLGLGALSWAHGPIVLFPEDGETLVLYTPEGWGLLGPTSRTVIDEPFVIRLPLLQRFVRIDTAERTVEVDATPTASGVAVRLAGGRVRHRVGVADASRVAATLGTDPGTRDALITDLTVAAWSEAVAGLDVAALADPAQIASRVDGASRIIADRAAAFGLEAHVDTRPAVEVDPEVAALLARIGEVEAQVDDRADGARQQTARSTDDRVALERRHRAEITATRASLQARLVEAEATLARARVDAERAYTARLAAADVEQHTLLAVARSIDARADAESGAARARVEALGQNGPRILDQVIATHVMPQLERVRTGTPSGLPQLGWMPVPPPPAIAAPEPADEPAPETAPEPAEETDR